nr:hypothetical protein [Micromonospora sp. DSM 115978]
RRDPRPAELSLLTERHVLAPDTTAGAALVAQLSWSFLDGIWSRTPASGPGVAAARLVVAIGACKRCVKYLVRQLG